MTATELRTNLFSVLSDAARTGHAAEVTYKGATFRIVPETKKRFTERLVHHDTFGVPIEEFLSAVENPSAGDWEWNEEKNLGALH